MHAICLGSKLACNVILCIHRFIRCARHVNREDGALMPLPKSLMALHKDVLESHFRASDKDERGTCLIYF